MKTFQITLHLLSYFCEDLHLFLFGTHNYLVINAKMRDLKFRHEALCFLNI